MFEIIEAKFERWKPSRLVAVWVAVFSAFVLGALSGILAREALRRESLDWTSLVVERGPILVLMLVMMIFFALSAIRNN